MPLPVRRQGEQRDAFVSRCIKEEHDKKSDMTDEQIIAVCEQQADISMLVGYDEYKLNNMCGCRKVKR